MKSVDLNKVGNIRHTLLLIIAGAIVCLLAGICTAQTKITLRQDVVVPGPDVKLREIADIKSNVPGYPEQLGAFQISIAPPVGVPLQLSRKMIEYKLKDLQVDTDAVTVTGPELITVALDTVLIPGTAFQKAAQEYLEEKIKVMNGSYEIQFLRTPAPKPAPRYKYSLKAVQGRIGRLKGSFSVNIAIFSGVKQYQTVPVYVRVRTFEPMVVAVRHIPFGTVISSDDVRLVMEESTTYNYDLIENIQSVVGKRAKISIAENNPVLLKNIEEPPLINKGDSVEIEVWRGSIVISCKGIARQEGHLGDVIQVKGVDSGTMYMATVVSTSKVTIQ